MLSSSPLRTSSVVLRDKEPALTNSQRLILNEQGISKAQQTHRVFATAWRAEQRPSDGNYRLVESVELDVCLVNDGKPLTGRIAALVKAKLGPEWEFTWWCPEPEFSEF